MSSSATNTRPEDHHRTGTHSSGNQNHGQPSSVRGGVGPTATPANRPHNLGFGKAGGSGATKDDTAHGGVHGMTNMVKDFFGKGAVWKRRGSEGS